MSAGRLFAPDPDLDLLLERVVDVPREFVWEAWTTPEQVVRWFTPPPFTTTQCEIDLRPGGLFRTVMRSPDGEETTNVGCYLEVVENERLVWTSVLGPGYRPRAPEGGFAFTAVISLESVKGGTRYTALAIHATPAERAEHEEMGFHDGWGTALDQIVALGGRNSP